MGFLVPFRGYFPRQFIWESIRGSFRYAGGKNVYMCTPRVCDIAESIEGDVIAGISYENQALLYMTYNI